MPRRDHVDTLVPIGCRLTGGADVTAPFTERACDAGERRNISLSASIPTHLDDERGASRTGYFSGPQR